MRVRPGILALLGAAAAGSAAWFMRDPERRPPALPGVVLAPADGRVLLVERAAAPFWLTGSVWRIAIFLSLWDVHVQRAPIAGKVVLSIPQSGPRLPAFGRWAARNAGCWLGIEGETHSALLLRTAGFVARRVTTEVNVGAVIGAGERIGRILLGSRVELFLPKGLDLLVRPRQYIRAGETIVAAAEASG
jgi:phosphatidylserine decarboxylase